MRQISFGTTLSLLLATVVLSSCSTLRPEPQVVTVTEAVQMNDIKIYVVSPEENYEEFVQEFSAKNGADSYIAISVKDYENLSKNFAELRRYIEQQKQIILYYESAIKNKEETDDKSDE